ncbi:UMP-CMP kinase [Hordeum vulgare]|nr:UMP-CMP kinase [Hordeum vulgare]
MRRSAKQSKCTYAMEEEDAGTDTDDEDYDPGLLVDSNNEIGNDDDDLYADNVDEDEPEQRQENKSNERAKHKGDQVQPKSQNKGKQKYDSDEDLSEGEDLWAPDSDGEELHFKLRTFRPEDLHRPTFHVGQVFESVKLLRTSIKEYSCQNRVDIKLPAKCDDDCTWYLWASYDNRTKAFMVKRYVHEHTCSKKWKIRAFTSKFLAMKKQEEKKLAASKREADKRLAAAQEKMKDAAKKAREQSMAAAKRKESWVDNEAAYPKKAPRSSMFDVFR